jgi:hypothetical protein
MGAKRCVFRYVPSNEIEVFNLADLNDLKIELRKEVKVSYSGGKYVIKK